MRKNILKSVILLSLLALGDTGVSSVSAAVVGTNYNSCYSAGEKAYAASDYSNAAENFAQALKYKPDDLRSHLKYAQTLFSLNRYDESQNHLQTVLHNSPNNIIARLFLAEISYKTGKIDAAKEQLLWILNVQPNHIRAKALLAEITGDVLPQEANVASKEEKLPEKEVIDEVKETEKIEVSSDSVGHEQKIIENSAVIEKTSSEVLYSERNVEPQKAEDVEMEIEVSDPYQSAVPQELESDQKVEPSIVKSHEENMVFTPYVAGQKKVREEKGNYEKPKMPKAKEGINKTDMQSFFKDGKESFVVTLEKARYEIEKGDLVSAEKSIEKAYKLARASENSRNMLEAQVFKSLVMVYKCDFTNFGRNLMTLKSALSTESYQSFLDIYSQSEELKNEDDKRRLAAGVAIGAGHNAVVASLLKPVFEKNTSDPILASMLSEAQFHCYDYEGAGNTLRQFAEARSDNAEAQFNLARFYLTADYKPELSRKYALLASELNPEDARNGIILGLIDYSEGKISEGMAKINGLLETVEDTSLKAICQRLVADGEANKGPDASKKFIRMLALPGTAYSDSAVFRFAGDDDLKAGSYFSAIEKYKKADEGVEIGRVYLGLASALTNAGETEMASVAAGYGIKVIKTEMGRGKGLSRASLYLALYNYERGDKESAMASVDLGFNCRDLDRSTYNKLSALYDNLTLL